MTLEPVRIVNAIIATIGILASTGLIQWLDLENAELAISLIVLWAAVFGINATVTRDRVTPNARVAKTKDV